jgi:hypothetical protein
MVHMCVCVWSGVAVCVCLTHVRQASAAAARLLAHQGRQTHTHTHMHCLTAVWKLDSMMPLAVPLGNGSRQSMIMSLRICVSMNTPSTAVISRYGMVREGSGSYTASPLKPGVPLGAPPRFKYVWYDMPAVRVVRSVRVARACARQVRARAASDILCDATGAVPEGGGAVCLGAGATRMPTHTPTHTGTQHAAPLAGSAPVRYVPKPPVNATPLMLRMNVWRRRVWAGCGVARSWGACTCGHMWRQPEQAGTHASCCHDVSTTATAPPRAQMARPTPQKKLRLQNTHTPQRAHAQPHLQHGVLLHHEGLEQQALQEGGALGHAHARARGRPACGGVRRPPGNAGGEGGAVGAPAHVARTDACASIAAHAGAKAQSTREHTDTPTHTHTHTPTNTHTRMHTHTHTDTHL